MGAEKRGERERRSMSRHAVVVGRCRKKHEKRRQIERGGKRKDVDGVRGRFRIHPGARQREGGRYLKELKGDRT